MNTIRGVFWEVMSLSVTGVKGFCILGQGVVTVYIACSRRSYNSLVVFHPAPSKRVRDPNVRHDTGGRAGIPKTSRGWLDSLCFDSASLCQAAELERPTMNEHVIT